MGNLDPLAFAGKDNRVIADHIAATQRCKADGAVFARTGKAVTAAHGDIVKINAPALGRCFTKTQGRAGRSIDLVFMVHFNDFDIGNILIKDAGNLFDQRKGQINPDTHIRGKDDRGLLGRDL